jgi:hypothetical protein
MPPKPIESSTTKEKNPMYTIPIIDRPSHGPIYSKIFFPILFNFGQIGINSAQILALPLLLIPLWGRGWFEGFIGWTKDGYGRLCKSFISIDLSHIIFPTAKRRLRLRLEPRELDESESGDDI